MKYQSLGSSGLKVSQVCLGTMTWGTQNTQRDGDEQIEYALSRGINFIDTAEMYSIPPDAESYGKTEAIIGSWLGRNPQRRQEFILASKIVGVGLLHIREGSPISGDSIKLAVDDSLKRLQTDYIDLFQLHWPNRPVAHFGRHWHRRTRFPDNRDAITDDIHDQLDGLADCVKAGKVRFCGLSNETPWGIGQFIRLAEQQNLPRVVSVQNEFSLIHSNDWPHTLEQCAMEEVAYLAWSPLGGGVLSGKYRNGVRPEGSRWTFPQRNRLFRDTAMVHEAVTLYSDIASRHGITPAQLALKWCNEFDEITSVIIGATSMDQLREDIDAFELTFSDELREEIVAALKKYPIPF